MHEVLRSQIEYYDARAGEYDDFWLRRGDYRLEQPLAGQWQHDADETLRFVRDQAAGDILELAAGTGIFTSVLHSVADTLHAVDASPRMLEANRARLGDSRTVTYEVADLFGWEPERTYDTIFFGFWLSHVPDDGLADFWSLVRRCLAPGGRVVLVDSRPYPETAAGVAVRVEDRNLADGRGFQIFKRYWTPETLSDELRSGGWDARVETSGNDLILRAVATRN